MDSQDLAKIYSDKIKQDNIMIKEYLKPYQINDIDTQSE